MYKLSKGKSAVVPYGPNTADNKTVITIRRDSTRTITRSGWWMSKETLHNVVDRDFYELLQPLSILQFLQGQPKFKIRYNFITPPTKMSYAVSFLVVILCLSGHLSLILNAPFIVMSVWLTIIACVYSSFNFISLFLFFAFNILHNLYNVEIMLKVQNAHRVIQMSKKDKRSYKIWNWVYILMMIPAYMLLVIGVSLFSPLTDYQQFFYVPTMIHFDLNVIYAFHLLRLLNTELKFWLQEVKRSSIYSNKSTSKSVENEDFRWKTFVDAYVNLLASFNIYKKVSQYAVLFIVMDTFWHTMLYIQYCIDNSFIDILLRYSVLKFLSKLMIVVFVLKNLFLLGVLVAQCEKFYININTVNCLCVRLQRNRNCTVEAKRGYKNIRRINSVVFCKMTSYSMFTVDATLPFSLCDAVSSYTTVLLLFALSG